MLALIAMWLALLIPALLTGSLLLSAFDRGARIDRPTDRFFLAAWLGLPALSLLCLTVSLLTPLTPAVGTAVGAALLLIAAASPAARSALLALRPTTLSWSSVFLALAAAVAASLYGTRDIRHYDTGLYHYPMIHWFAESGLVPGLALIHARFAFASTWLTLPAIFDHGALTGRVTGLTGSLVLWLVATQWLCAVRRWCRGEARAADRYAAIALGGSIVYLADKAWLISASPDTPAFMVAVLMGWVLLLSSRRDLALSPLIPLLALAALCLKLSMLPLLLAATLLFLFAGNHRRDTASAWRLIVAAVFVVVPLVLASLLTSGCLVFPVASTCLHVSWGTGADVAGVQARQILLWARWLGTIPSDAAGMGWLPRWLDVHSTEVGMAVLATLLLALRWRRLVGIPGAASAVMISLFCIASGVVSAPDPRFWGGSLLAMAGLAGVASLAAPRAVPPPRSRWLQVLSPVLALLLVMTAVSARQSKSGVPTDAPRGAWLWLPPMLRAVPVQPERTPAGVDYVIPADGDQCWRAAPPCAPSLLPTDIAYGDAARGPRGGFRHGSASGR